MNEIRRNLRTLWVLPCIWLLACGDAGSDQPGPGSGGALNSGGAGVGGVNSAGLAGGFGFGGSTNGGNAAAGSPSGGSSGGLSSSGGAASGGSFSGSGGASRGGTSNQGGTVSTGGKNAGGASSGGASSGGATTSAGGTPTGGSSSSGGTGGGAPSAYECDGPTSAYTTVMTQSGSTWTVTKGTTQVHSGSDMRAALVAAYGSLASGRTSKQSILVRGSGDIAADQQVSIPSYTVLNVCGTINVSGTPSGSDRSPLYARNAREIEIPNLKMTGSPQYGIFMRQTDNVHLGQIDLQLTKSAGIGIRVDSGPNAGSSTNFNSGLTIDHVYGSGMGSHIVETYGISNIKIGTVEGKDVGECGLLLNRSINAEVGTVNCTDCAKGTGYAAFRVANSVGKVGSAFPAGNIKVGKVIARGGGRGIFSVSGSGGLTIDEIDIANTGSTPILLQNAYNTTIAAVSGKIVGGQVVLSNDTDNTNDGTYLPSQNVALKNLVLSGGASVRQDWCSQFGANGCTATNISGGTVSMCQ